MKSEITYLNYCKAVLTINLTVFGGAPLTIGSYEEEFVKTNILKLEELNKYVAVGNILPGAMSFYVAGLIGYRLFKFRGLISGVFLCAFPIMLITILTYNILMYYNLNLEYLIIAVFPIIILNTVKYLKTLIDQDLNNILKYCLFITTIILLTVFAMTSLNVVILFLLFTIIYSAVKGVENV